MRFEENLCRGSTCYRSSTNFPLNISTQFHTPNPNEPDKQLQHPLCSDSLGYYRESENCYSSRYFTFAHFGWLLEARCRPSLLLSSPSSSSAFAPKTPGPVLIFSEKESKIKDEAFCWPISTKVEGPHISNFSSVGAKE